MAVVPFKYYLHDDYSSHERAMSLQGQIPELADMEIDAISELIGRPFYEITLSCTLDTETGEVKVLETIL